MWHIFKRQTFQATRYCIGEHPRSRRKFASAEALECVAESCIARLAWNHDQYRVLARRNRTFLRREKKWYDRSFTGEVESNLSAKDLCTTFGALKKFPFKSTPQVSSI